MKNLILVLAALMSTQAMAAGAALYSCVGKDANSGEAVVYELAFSDYAHGVGYTNEAITVLRQGGNTLQNPVVLQMFEATKQNNCSLNSLGETYMFGGFDMQPTEQGHAADFKVSFKANCPKVQLDVVGYCTSQY